MSTNGTPNFTNSLGEFELEGITFRRRKVNAKVWAETLQRVASQEQQAIEDEGGMLFAVSAEGLYELIRVGINEADQSEWDRLWNEGMIEFGELTDIREWMWEKMTERPFSSRTASSDGPGSTSEASSRDASPSLEAVPTG
jgi:hypothetical protein